MKILAGCALHGQIVLGPLHFYRRPSLTLESHSERSVEQEELRFLWAQKHSVLELSTLYERATREVGNELASIFAIHAMLLEDGDYNRRIKQKIRSERIPAEYAVHTVGAQIAQSFADMESEYMRERAADIQDITRRMEYRLLNQTPPTSLGLPPSILVADTFLPSEVMELDRHQVLGLISTRGGVTSHTAHLLTAYNIPAMAEVRLDRALEGQLALMDGFDHKLYLNPDDDTTERLCGTCQESDCMVFIR